MAYLVQAGTTLYHVSTGGTATALTLPTGITLYGASQPCRAVVFAVGQFPIIVIVNGATRDFFIDRFGNTYPLAVAPPMSAPIPTAGTGTGLTGVYSTASTFKIKDSLGATILESGMGPISSGSAALANKSLRVDNIPVSGVGAVNCRGMYRTLTGGNVLYPWFDIDDNLSLAEDRGGADAVLSLIPAVALSYGTPPDLKLCVAWRDRLWGVPRSQIDSVRWTEERVFYGWNATNELIVPPLRADSYGATALIPRRDDLGIGRRNRLYKVVGNSNASFQRINVSETLGPINQESVVVRDNIAYFLTEFGVASWSDEGVGLISEAQVDGWFTTDTYFNRAMFPSAQGRYNPDTHAYELLLAAVGSSVLDRWIAYSILERRWLGPHKTAAFTPTCTANSSEFKGVVRDANNLPQVVFGSVDGYLYRRDLANLLDHLTAVDFDVDLPPLAGYEPDYYKVWDRPTIHTRAETQGTLNVSAAVGNKTAALDAADPHDLTLDREVLARLGAGEYARLNLRHTGTTERPRIYGIELPFQVTGRR